MKKLLILALVFGMTSLASAAISLDGPTSINEGDTVSIGINNLDGGDYLAYMNISLISQGGFSLGTPALTGLAGDISGVGVPYEYAGGHEIEVTLAQSTGTSAPGVQFTWDLTCLKAGVAVTIELWDAADFSAPVDVLTIAQVPEPMTIALLGLGGLFMLRRRK
jgi:hypothetical protein